MSTFKERLRHSIGAGIITLSLLTTVGERERPLLAPIPPDVLSQLGIRIDQTEHTKLQINYSALGLPIIRDLKRGLYDGLNIILVDSSTWGISWVDSEELAPDARTVWQAINSSPVDDWNYMHQYYVNEVSFYQRIINAFQDGEGPVNEFSSPEEVIPHLQAAEQAERNHRNNRQARLSELANTPQLQAQFIPWTLIEDEHPDVLTEHPELEGKSYVYISVGGDAKIGAFSVCDSFNRDPQFLKEFEYYGTGVAHGAYELDYRFNVDVTSQSADFVLLHELSHYDPQTNHNTGEYRADSSAYDAWSDAWEAQQRTGSAFSHPFSFVVDGR